MIKQITIAAVLVTLVAYFIYSNLASPDRASSGQFKATDSNVLQRPVAVNTSEPEPAATIDDGTEIVLGLRVRKDRDCRVDLKDYVTPDGNMFTAYSCTPNAAAQVHIYAEYDNDTLASMAYSDADAAALLGRRFIDKNTRKSYELLIRAAALDGGNVEHLAWLSDQAFGATNINGEPQLENLQRQYELAALANRLGDGPGKIAYLRSELVRHGIEDAQLDALDSRVDALLRSMRDIQRTVLGRVTIGGQDDA